MGQLPVENETVQPVHNVNKQKRLVIICFYMMVLLAAVGITIGFSSMYLCKKFQMEKGALVKGMVKPGIYLIMDDTFRLVPNSDVYYNLFGGTPHGLIDQDILDKAPKGIPLLSNAMLVRADDDPIGHVYLNDQLANGTEVKRWIVSPDAFNRYGFSWGKIVNISNTTSLISIDGENIE